MSREVFYSFAGFDDFLVYLGVSLAYLAIFVALYIRITPYREMQLIREGNIRRMIIRNEKGTTLIEIPLTVGLVGAALLPVWAAVGAIAALATDCTIVIERRE